MKIFRFSNHNQGIIDGLRVTFKKSIPTSVLSEERPTMDDIIKSGRSTVISSLTMGILATITTSLRFLAKLETKAGLAVDDYWITISLAIYWIYTGVAVWSIFHVGGGLDMPNIASGNLAAITLYVKV